MKKILQVVKKCLLANSLIFTSMTGFAQSPQLHMIKSVKVGEESAAEILAYDKHTATVWVLNAPNQTIDIYNVANVFAPDSLTSIDVSDFGGGVNSIAFKNGMVALALQAPVKQDNGVIRLIDTDDLSIIDDIPAGALPDMVKFNSDGTKLLSANEGEPNGDYSVDPEGSITIVTLAGKVVQNVQTATFHAYDNKKEHLKNKGVRISGPNATVSQDLEPEYIAITEGDSLAYVTLQENNAVAVVNMNTAQVVDIYALGYKDHSRGDVKVESLVLNQMITMPELGIPVYDEDHDDSNGFQAAPRVDLGGFSGLCFDKMNSTQDNMVFYAVPDRGPNGDAVAKALVGTPQNARPFKLPNYASRLVKIQYGLAGLRLNESDYIYLRRIVGNDTIAISGKGNIPGFDEVPVTYTEKNTEFDQEDYLDTAAGVFYHELEYDPFGGDFEGVIQDKDGNFWLCDEYRPAVYKFNSEGILIHRFVPQGTSLLGKNPQAAGFYGTETLPAIYSKRWANRGFEAIAYNPDSNLIYAFIQSPLYNPGSVTKDKSDIIRILAIDAQTGMPVHEYVYVLERNSVKGQSISRVDKIGDAVYKGNGIFYVLERDSSTPDKKGGQKYVFEINLKGATDLMSTPELQLLSANTDTVGIATTLELLTIDQLVSNGIHPVHKRKVLNLATAGYVSSDKAEGLAYLPNNDALVVVNDNDFGLAGAGVTDNTVLGFVHFDDNYGFDASDKSKTVDIKNRPTLGMFQPDAIAAYSFEGMSYYITANEGDGREYVYDMEVEVNDTTADGRDTSYFEMQEFTSFIDEAKIGKLKLDTMIFNPMDSLQKDDNLGRLLVTNTMGDLDGDGYFDELYTYGARSFSIIDAYGNMLYDSGDDFEQIALRELGDTVFNVSWKGDKFSKAKDRSDNKGPEPEGVVTGVIDGKTYAFIGLERQGGVMVYDVTNPKKVSFVDYINTSNFGFDSTETPGNISPEGLEFIPADESPNGMPLLLVAYEVSGTFAMFQFTPDVPTSTVEITENAKNSVRVYPNPSYNGVLNVDEIADLELISLNGVSLAKSNNTTTLNVGEVPSGIYSLKITIEGTTEVVKVSILK